MLWETFLRIEFAVLADCWVARASRYGTHAPIESGISISVVPAPILSVLVPCVLDFCFPKRYESVLVERG